ncbi:MAG: hypothetical protein HC812_02835 [Leptolyngbya sp. RL_3_1]|nr:hypothetical protein [Leptolyngbya sp. RL_3_1]
MASPLSNRSNNLVFVLWLLSVPWVIYALIAERWPIADVIRFQVNLTNGYYFPKLTIAIALLGTMVVALMVGLLVDLVTRKGPFRRRGPQ